MDAHSANSIPNYDLYGEAGDLPDILHCEPISERAPLHDWNIAPHRHQRLHQFFVISSGGGWIDLDGRRLTLWPSLLINVPALAVHAFGFEKGTEGWVITVPTENVEAVNPPAALLSTAASSGADEELMGMFQRAARECSGARPGRSNALRAYVGLLTTLVARRIDAARPDHEHGGHSEFLQRFRSLIEAHYRDHWSVRRYADELTVSPTHLSRLVRAETGMPASRLIEARLVHEARRSLAYTTLSVSQIAYDLGFDDPAYFTRVFRRATGRAPSDYRRHLERPRHDRPPRTAKSG